MEKVRERLSDTEESFAGSKIEREKEAMRKAGVPEWKIEIAFKEWKEKLEKKKAQHSEDLKRYNDKFNELVSFYFQYRSTDEELNEFNYNLLNKEWKDLVKKVNALNKLVKLKYNLFETAVSDILAKEQEKEKEEALKKTEKEVLQPKQDEPDTSREQAELIP